MGGASSSQARPTHGVRWNVKDPISGGLVLPRPRLEKVAHDGDPSGAAHAFGRLQGIRQTEDLMATGDQKLDQL
jgi:hypothetical protein